MFERDEVALPRVASFFHQEALKQQQEAEAMLGYLAERGGNYCGKDVQVRPARSLMLYVIFLFLSILFVQFEVLLHYIWRSEVRMCCPEALQQAGGGFVCVVRGPDDSETGFMF